MQKTDPQGKNDPKPTPEPELERYGVWVKEGPRDVIDDSIPEGSQFEPAAAVELDSSPLTADEEDLLEAVDEPTEGDALGSMDDFDDLPPLSDFEAEGAAESPASLGDVQLDDVPLDEFELEDMPSDASGSAESSIAESVPTTDVNIEDFDLDGDLSGSPSLEAIGEVEPGRTLADSQAAGTVSDDFESLDIDLEFDDTIPSDGEAATHASPAGDSEFEAVELDSIDEAGPDAAAELELGSNLEMEPVAMDSFIDADESAEYSAIPEAEMEDVSLDMAETAEPAPRDDAAADLMATIARELSSIKQELVSLRSQLGELRASGAAPTPAPAIEEEEQEEQSSGGFFDDEDDDTIALTGDELDNILNTADFTEEAASDESLPEDGALDIELPSGIDLLPEDGDYSLPSEPGIEAFDAGDDGSEAVLDVAEAELPIDVDEGVTPLVSPPSDTSFLDDDTDATLELDEEPLEEAPLVEPDLGDLDLLTDSTFGADEEELPIAEPALDEVEIVESMEGAPDEPEIVLDLPDDASPVVSTVDAFPEPLEEIEDVESLDELDSSTDLGGVELHAEELRPEDGIGLPIEADAASEAGEAVVHPDDYSTSLDDSLFVEGPAAEEAVDTPNAEPAFGAVDSPNAEPAFGAVEAPAPVEPTHAAPLEEPSRIEPQARRAANRQDTVDEKPAAQADVPDKLKQDVKSVLAYLDNLLYALPEEKVEEFANSEYFDTYKKLFEDLGIV